MNADTIKNRFAFYVSNPAGVFPPSVNARGVYVGKLNIACGGDANRKLVLKYLTGKTSTKALTDAEWGALRKMCDATPSELEEYCAVILGACVKNDGQMEMAV